MKGMGRGFLYGMIKRRKGMEGRRRLEGGSRIKYGTIKRAKRKEGWRVRREEGESMGRSREQRKWMEARW